MKFGHGLAKAGKKRNHVQAKSAKIEMRRRVLDAIGRERANVFDAFAGTGVIYRALWHEAAGYTGCDLDWFRDERLAYVGDNRRVMRSIDLMPFNIFDLDAFGSPWEQVLILIARRPIAPGERIGLLLTDGSGLQMKQGGISHALAQVAGLSGKLNGLHRWQNDVLDRAIAGMATRLNVDIEARWQAERKGGASMRYCALVLAGRGSPPAP